MMNLRENTSARGCRIYRSACRVFARIVARRRLVSAAIRFDSMMNATRSDCYDYNRRKELTNAVKNATLNEYAYQYDDIGNRLSSRDLGDGRQYESNNLNQYVSIAESEDEFTPQFDDDGNQTLVKTSTGVWSVTCNGENRPVLWSCGATNITMKYDRMGRRVEYLETVTNNTGGPDAVSITTNSHHRFVYDGYLCIQRLNAAANNSIDLAFGWDPTEPVATRPLWMQRVSGTYNFFYFHDGNKNVSDLVSYQSARGVPAHYEYAPFGTVTAATTNIAFTAFKVADINPYRFSSEYADDTLGLVYYNYRHYEPVMGRWLSRDPIEERGGANVYAACQNQLVSQEDMLGFIIHPQFGFDTTPIRIPPFPTPLDQIRGVKPHGEEAWFEKNYPGWLAEARRRFTAEIEAAVDCKTASFEGPSERISIRPSEDRGGMPFYRTRGGNEQQYGDAGQSDFSADKILGEFAIDYVTPVEIKYTDIGGGKRRYEWSTEMYIEDVLGLQDHDRLAQIRVLGGFCKWLCPSRRVKRARWTLSGSGECDCEERR